MPDRLGIDLMFNTTPATPDNYRAIVGDTKRAQQCMFAFLFGKNIYCEDLPSDRKNSHRRWKRGRGKWEDTSTPRYITSAQGLVGFNKLSTSMSSV